MTTFRRRLVLAAPLLLVACAKPPPAPPLTMPEDPNAIAAPACGRHAARRRIEPIERDGTGQGIALVRTPATTLAYVADPDANEIRIVDMETRREVGTHELDGTPATLLALRDGRVLVALRDRARVDVLEPLEDPTEGFEERCSIDVPTEPVALAVNPDQSELLVASRWGHAITALDTATLARRAAIEVDRDPTAVLVARDGKSAFVTHATGKGLSLVRLDGALEARVVDAEAPVRLEVAPDDFFAQRMARQRLDQAFTLVRAEGSILVPGVLIDPGDGEVMESSGYGSGFGAAPRVFSISEDAPDAQRPDVLGSTDCHLPRAAAYDPESLRLFVACADSDEIATRVVASPRQGSLEDERRANAMAHFGASIRAAKLLTSIALDVDKRRGVALSLQGPSLTFFDLDVPSEVEPTTVALEPHRSAMSAAAEHGRLIFHESESRKVAADGRACASCHMDGRDDGVTWTTEQGPRQTPMLVDRLAGTGPYGWDGANKDVESHLVRTIERLQGRGISDAEKRDVLAYLATLHVPAEQPARDPVVARGEQIFHAKETGCSTCHLGEESLTDGLAHDVKSRSGKEKVRRFDTPSLKFIAASAPYFHDGRFATLGELLDGTDGTMGHTKQLSPEDRAALEAYLRSL